jgi:microcystin-dependent protein
MPVSTDGKKRRGYLVPEQVDGHDLLCVTLRVPNDQRHIGAFLGAVHELGKWWAWERGEDTGNLEAALYWRHLLYDWLRIGECDMPNSIPAGLSVGMVVAYAGELPLPDNLLMCDGQAHNALDYPELYEVIHPSFKFMIPPDTLRFYTPLLIGNMIRGADPEPTDPIDHFGIRSGQKEVTLTTAQIPAHNHEVPANSNATTFGLGRAGRTNNTGVTQNNINTTSEGSGQPHDNMPPYKNLWWVIVAKTDVIEPREIIMDKQIISPDCERIYWRYSDEHSSSNRLLSEVCDGAPGAPGAPGAIPDCPDCDDTPIVPDPPEENYPPDTDKICIHAGSMVDFVRYVQDEATQQFNLIGAGTGLFGAVMSLFAAIFLPAAVLSAAIVGFLGVLVGFVNAGQDALIDNNDWADLKCLIYCILGLDGRLTETAYNDLLAELDIKISTRPEWVMIRKIIETAGVEGMNNAAKTLTNLDANCDACAQCTWCKTFDFTVGTHGWTDLNGGTSNHTLGVGWTGFDVTTDQARRLINIYIPVAASVKHIDYVYDLEKGSVNDTSSSCRHIMSSLSTGAIGSDRLRNHTFSGSPNTTDGSTNWQGNPRIMSHVRCWLASSRGSYGGTAIIKQITIRGTGHNPFGEDNC